MQAGHSILIVDDDRDILRTNKRYLSSRGYLVDTAGDAQGALSKLKENQYACILLDVMLPDMDGYALCAGVRALTSAPVIFVSCLDSEDDKIKGLVSGGDDYMTKPYSLKELSTRIYAQIRRASIGSFFLDASTKTVYSQGNGVSLSQKEFDLFRKLYEHPNTVFSVRELYGALWGEGSDTGTVAVHMRRLREKLAPVLETAGELQTVRGSGYRFVPAEGNGARP